MVSVKNISWNKKSVIFITLLVIFGGLSFVLFFLKSNTISGTENWTLYQNKTCGIEFKHPKEIIFSSEEGSKGLNSCVVSANILEGKDKETYFSLVLYSKLDAEETIASITKYGNNFFLPNSVSFQNGVFFQIDGTGTADYYFIDDYYVGEKHGYKFMMSRPKYDKDMAETFQKILMTVKLIEPNY